MATDNDVRAIKRELESTNVRNPLKPTERSVRTTFRLTDQSRELLERISNEYGLSEKDAVDHCVSLMDFDREPGIFLKAALRDLATEMTLEDARRKSHVVAKSTLDTLARLSDKTSITRDRLVNVSIIFATVVGEFHKEQRRKAYRTLLSRVTEVWVLVEDLENEFFRVTDEYPINGDYSLVSACGVIQDWKDALVDALRDDANLGEEDEPDA